jgi:hypothetical protein
MSTLSTPDAPEQVVVVFRINKTGESPDGISGHDLMAGLLRASLPPQESTVMALLPYVPLPPGEKSRDMVAALNARGERVIVHWPSVIKDTRPSTMDEHGTLLADMLQHGYAPEVIEARQVDALRRRAEVPMDAPEAEPEAEPEIEDDTTVEVESFTINGTIGGEVGFGSGFTEEWA